MTVCVRLWLLLLLINSPLLAQPFRARNLSLQQGLPEYYASGIVQDKEGFIWVATLDGLARYDGRQFKVFRHRLTGTPSLASNVILSMEPVSDSTLLLYLENRTFQLFNPITEQFSDLLTDDQLARHQVNMVKVILTPDEKTVWGRFRTQLTRFDRQTGRFTAFPFPPFPDAGLFPGNSLLLAKDHQLFAPAPGRLLQFDTQTGTFHSWAHSLIGLSGTIDTYYGTPLIQRSNGEILIGAARQLLRFDPKTHRFVSIPIPSAVDTQTGLIYEAPDGQVYFTYGMTVYQLSANNQVTAIWTAPRLDYQNYFHALLLDRSGVLWIGTNGDGMYQIDQRALPIKTYPYRINFFVDVLESELGLAVPSWAQTDQQLYQLRIAGTAPYLTIGIEGRYELLRGDQANHRFRSLLTLPRKTQLGDYDGGNALRQEPDGTLWLFDPHQGLLKADSAGRLLAVFACPTPINRVSSIQPLGQYVWIGSQVSGLYAYDLQTRRIVRHLSYQPDQAKTLLSNPVNCLAADPVNPAILWVGTHEGLCRLDTRTMRGQNWTDEQGLPSATINTLLTDRQGNLWFSTGRGISRLNLRTYRLRHFSTYDGLLDIEYRPNQALRLPDGRMAFGGATGVSVFDPLALTDVVEPIPTVLTGLRLANLPIEPGKIGSPLRLPLNATPALRLQFNQNFLSLEYAGLQYNKPASLQYRYQLTGVDAHWVYAGNQTVANYTQLDPGDYEFRVNTANASGRWSPIIKTLRIIIAPPWWQTWWAYGLYGLVVLVLVRAYIQYRINQAQLRQDMALQEQQARLIKENADWQTRFFTNITHEFRTPLTLIINPLERMMETAAPSLQQPYGVMHRNARRLLRLINQLLDMAKLEAGQLGMVLTRGNLARFFSDLVDSFRLRAERKGVQLRYEPADMPTDSLFDAHKLETIGYNLLDNALKFTPAGGHIRMLLHPVESASERSFQLQVIDSGGGIPDEQLPRIFERFYQGRQAGGNAGTGTGIGLFLIAEFTRLLGGHVQVESQEGQGTTFTVTLPLQKATDTLAVLDAPTEWLRPASTELAAEAIAGTESADTAQTAPAPATAPMVLVVEDNDELREFMAGELARTYRVLTAPNGQEGWQICLAELPDLVISDVMMPLMDGFTLVERIKTTPLTAHIAVMLLTAKTMTESRIQGLTAGANDYLTKPFHGQELHLRIANLLRHQQQLRQHWQQQTGPLPSPTSPVARPNIDDPFLAKFYQILDRELANSAFSVDLLADELAVSYRTLHRKLSALTGTSANELIRIHRLQQAARLLQDGYSISETAEKAGFEGLSYFAKMFKAHFGMTPTAFVLAQGPH
ncbi:hybrid sensor histidine kinase/response regulator transcription factor [Spirosoma koreense]